MSNTKATATSKPFVHQTVNPTGFAEIKSFLARHHKLGKAFSSGVLSAWAFDAESELKSGNPASIQIGVADSNDGQAHEYTISAAGLGLPDKRYAVVDNFTGFVWGVTDAQSALLACKQVDDEIETSHGFAYAEVSELASNETGYHVYGVEPDFDVLDGQDAVAIRAVHAHERVAIIKRTEEGR